MKEWVDIIRWLTEDLNQRKKDDKGKEIPDGGGIYVELPGEKDPTPPAQGERKGSGKKKRKRNNEDDEDKDAREVVSLTSSMA